MDTYRSSSRRTDESCRIGGFYAYVLGKNEDVSLSVIARSNYDAVKERGLHIDSEIHGKQKVNIDHGTI
jgi:ketopantoate reductase